MTDFQAHLDGQMKAITGTLGGGASRGTAMSNVVTKAYISQTGCDNTPYFKLHAYEAGDLDAALDTLRETVGSFKGTPKEAVLHPYKYVFYALFRSNSHADAHY
jgi:hypothetical protein